MTHEHHTPENHGKDWDELYADEQVWSGNPNGALVNAFAHQLLDLKAGTALDVGCGEGADAVWLAQRGWHVSALDVVAAALARGRAAAQATGVEDRIRWIHAGLLDAHLEEAFNLVTICYPALRQGDDVEGAVARLVAPGGVLFMVAHANIDRERALEHGFNPDDYVTCDDIAESLDDSWQVERFVSERNLTEGAGAHHHEDIVFIARKA